MAEQSLSNGHVFKFKRENSNLILTEASDHSHEETLFRKQIKISGSTNSIYADGIVQITNYNATPGLKITSGGTDGDGVIGFYGGGTWIMGQEQGIDEFRIVNSTVISGTGNKAFAIDSSNNVSIPNGDLTVGDDLFVNDCAHIDALHVGVGTDTDPGDGNLLVDGKLKFHDVDNEDVIQIAQSGNTYGYIKWYDSNSATEQAAWIGHDAGNNRFTIKVKHEGGDNASRYYHFQENGDAIFPGSITVTSDVRLKENIRTLENPLDQILQLNGVKFNWKHGTDKKDHIGFIAQEVERIIPEVVITSKVTIEDDESMRVDNQKSVAYQNIVPVLVEAIKELSDKVEALEKRLGN